MNRQKRGDERQTFMKQTGTRDKNKNAEDIGETLGEN